MRWIIVHKQMDEVGNEHMLLPIDMLLPKNNTMKDRVYKTVFKIGVAIIKFMIF